MTMRGATIDLNLRYGFFFKVDITSQNIQSKEEVAFSLN